MGILVKRLKQLKEITNNLGFIELDADCDNGEASFTNEEFEIDVKGYLIVIDIYATANYKDVDLGSWNPIERWVNNKSINFEIVEVSYDDVKIDFNKLQLEFLKKEIYKAIEFNP